MVNLSTKTRKELVLERLRAAKGDWVSTVELSSKEVGGSEGIRRLRELRAEGHNIERRPNPDKTISQWQYRLEEGVRRSKITLPYVQWKASGLSALTGSLNGWQMYVHRLWDGGWQWEIRKGGDMHRGKAWTQPEALRDATFHAAGGFET